jgi:hypothetical protein
MIQFDSVTYSTGENTSGIPENTPIIVTPGLFHDNYFVINCRLKNGEMLDSKELKKDENPVFIGYFSPLEDKQDPPTVRDVRRGINAKIRNITGSMFWSLFKRERRMSPRNKNRGVLVVRDVQRGIIGKGQNFTSRTLNNVIKGFERAGHEIKEVMFDLVFISIDKLKLDNSPVLKALAKAGYGKIRVVEMDWMPKYYKLIGEPSEEESCEYELLGRKG